MLPSHRNIHSCRCHNKKKKKKGGTLPDLIHCWCLALNILNPKTPIIGGHRAHPLRQTTKTPYQIINNSFHSDHWWLRLGGKSPTMYIFKQFSWIPPSANCPYHRIKRKQQATISLSKSYNPYCKPSPFLAKCPDLATLSLHLVSAYSFEEIINAKLLPLAAFIKLSNFSITFSKFHQHHQFLHHWQSLVYFPMMFRHKLDLSLNCLCF